MGKDQYKKSLRDPDMKRNGGTMEGEGESRLRTALTVIPLILIVILSVMFFMQQRENRSRQAGSFAGKAGDPSITVQQKSSEKKSLLETKQTISVETIQDGLREMGFLITEEYYFTEMVTNKKIQSLGVFELGFTEESYVASYEGYITAGIDFTKIQVRNDEEAKTVTVTLPPAEVKDTVIDPDSFQVYDEKHSIFNDFTEQERADAMIRFKEDVLQKADEKGILQKADKNAELVVRNFIAGFVPQDCKIVMEKGE